MKSFGSPTLWDYKRHAELLATINDLTLDGVPLRNAFQIDGWNAWQWYQGLLFESVKWRVVDGLTPSIRMMPLKSFVGQLIRLSFFGILSAIGFVSALIRRPQVLLYSIDLKNSRFRGDQRIRSAYEAFRDTKTRYIECFHVYRGRKTIENWIQRRRNAFYLEGADIIFALYSIFRTSPCERLFARIDFSSIPEADRALAKEVVRNILIRIDLSHMRIRVFRFGFRLLPIRHLLLVDDPRHFWELIAAAEKEGIPSTALQHGHYTRYQVGLFTFPYPSSFKYLSPDAIIVWSDYWKHVLERYGSVFHQVIVGGYKDPVPEELPRREVGTTLRVLVPYESVAPKEAVRQYLQLLRAEADIQIIFKPRPDSPIDLQRIEYDLIGDDIEIMTALPKNLRDAFDIAIGTYTTLLSELIMQGVPVALLETPMDYGDGLIENGVADRLLLEPRGTLRERLRAIASTNQDILVQRRTEMTRGGTTPMKDAISERIRR